MSPYLHSLAQWLFLHLPGWILAGYIASLVFIFIYSLSQAHLMLHYIRSRRKSVRLPKASISGELPYVTVQLPVYNEKYVVARLLESVAGLRYPAHRLEIQVLDDSTDETTEIIARKAAELSTSTSGTSGGRTGRATRQVPYRKDWHRQQVSSLPSLTLTLFPKKTFCWQPFRNS